MALDYVKSLRDLEDSPAQEALRPRVKTTPAQQAAQEASAREADRENGRFGRFRDQRGQWATAWQAPGRRTPIVPPAFIAPSALSRLPSGELTLTPEGGEAVLVPPQSWLVRYENAAEVIVADDDQFREVMTREDKIREPIYAEEPPDPDEPQQSYPQDANPIPTAPSPSVSTSLSVDNFVAQVLSDNQRLRIELAAALAGERQADREGRAVLAEATKLRNTADQLNGRLHWLQHHVWKAMGVDPKRDVFGDADVEYFLADAGRSRAEDETKVEAAKALAVGTNGQGEEAASSPAPEEPPPKPASPRRSALKVSDVS